MSIICPDHFNPEKKIINGAGGHLNIAMNSLKSISANLDIETGEVIVNPGTGISEKITKRTE